MAFEFPCCIPRQISNKRPLKLYENLVNFMFFYLRNKKQVKHWWSSLVDECYDRSICTLTKPGSSCFSVLFMENYSDRIRNLLSFKFYWSTHGKKYSPSIVFQFYKWLVVQRLTWVTVYEKRCNDDCLSIALLNLNSVIEGFFLNRCKISERSSHTQ